MNSNIRKFYRIYSLIKMTGRNSIERIKQNAEVTKQTLEELKNELNIINEEYNLMLVKQLRDENAKLSAAVEIAKKKLIHHEILNGVEQIPIPNHTPTTVEQKESSNTLAPVLAVKEQPKKEKKKPKEVRESLVEAPINVGRLDLRIGKVEEVQRHPDADSLYVLKINCGEEKPRTVCSGLVKHVPIEELRDRTVVLLCNLKPVKMRGITSEAMVMCASSENGVEVLTPPSGSEAGDLVTVNGFERKPDPIMNPKKKILETVSPDLHTNDNLQACYKNVPFEVPNKGYCLAKTLKNVPVK